MNPLLVLVVASAWLLHDWSKVSLLGWTADGSAVAWEASVQSLEKPDGVLPCERVFMVVADSNGRALRVYRSRSRVPMEEVTWIDPDADSLWKAAASEDDGQKWIASHHLLAVRSTRKLTRTLEDKGGREPLKATLQLDGKACPAATLAVTLGKAGADVARDTCPSDESPGKGLSSTLQIVRSPNGRHAALAWNTTRPGPQSDEVIRGHFALASRRTLSRVEVMAGGATSIADSVAVGIWRAGFTVARSGKAPAPAAATMVTYASGYLPEAQEVARIVGVDPNSVRPAKGRMSCAVQVTVGVR